jgi:hypothetical protein
MLVRRLLRRSMSQIRHVSVAGRPGAGDLVGRVYRQVETDFGLLAPPIGLHSPAPDVLAAAWLMLRESLVANGFVARATKEAVAAGVSLSNACPYCVEVHGATLHGLLPEVDDGTITDGRLDSIPEPGIRAAATWAHSVGTQAGAKRSETPFPAAQAPEFVGVAVTFHYLNRMVRIFLGDSPLPPNVPAAARGRAQRFLGRMMRRTARRPHEPGASLDLLSPAPLPEDLRWAAGNPAIAGAFARAAAAVDAAGARSVPEPVRSLVTTQLAGWDGRPPGLSRAWVTAATAELPADVRPAGTLALLTAMAAYQVDQPVIDEFRRHRPQDRALIDVTSWASLAAARRVAGWIPAARPGPGLREAG